MKNYISIIIVLILILGQSIKAQPRDGENICYPDGHHLFIKEANYQRSGYNTANYSNDYNVAPDTPTNDVCIEFTILNPMKLTFSTLEGNDPIKHSNLYFGTGSCNLINNVNCQEFNLIYSGHDILITENVMMPGKYYLFFGGQTQDGLMTISISGKYDPLDRSFSAVGDVKETAIPVLESGYSSLPPNFTFEDRRCTNGYLDDVLPNGSFYYNNDIGTPANDVFYKMVLTETTDVKISHCDRGTTLDDTYITLLNADGSINDSNDDYTGEDRCGKSTKLACLKKRLVPGTYYVVSEGYSENGWINTIIKGSSPATDENGNLLPYPAIVNPDIVINNYIKTYTPRSVINDYAGVKQSGDCMQTIQYFDGLGRPEETVQKDITVNNGVNLDLVNRTEYDNLGRVYLHWLPISNNGHGAYVDPLVFTGSNNTKATYYNGDGDPYTETIYGENSPLNRVTGQRRPGTDWSSKPSGISYQTNIAGEVRCYSVNINNQLVMNANAYAAGTLYKTCTTDEDGKSTTQFKDKLGQIIMTRSSTNVDTYYIYNDLEQLCYVLSPEASDKLSNFTIAITMPDSVTGQTDANTVAAWQLAYHYRYDTRGNCIYKKLPGCRPIYMVYDRADRLVLSQDGNQRVIVQGKNQWTVTKYDAFGRIILSGISKEILTTKTLDALVQEYAVKLITETRTTDNTGYSNFNFADATPLKINYYDTYDYQNLTTYSGIKSKLIYKDYLTDATLTGFDTKYSNLVDNSDISCKGLLTGTSVAMLDNSMTLVTAMYYDDKGRVIQTHANNHLNGYDFEFFHYSFTGQVLSKRHIHQAFTNAEITENYRFTYDIADKLTGEYHQLNTQPEIALATMTYDDLGRMNQKILHGGIQTISYTYNIQSWLKSISSLNFNETLYYQDSPYGNACYNGNISAHTFGTGNDKLYVYSYDDLNRFKSATNSSEKYYNEKIDKYDKNGNIRRISRTGDVYYSGSSGTASGLIDDLYLTYNGNQLTSVNDDVSRYLVIATNDFEDRQESGLTAEYLYDANGNQTADLNKGIAWIKYNSLNLPQKIQFRDNTKNEYLYDASGVKHRAMYNYSTSTALIPLGATTQENTLASTFQTDYCGNYVYEKSGTGNPVLKRILTPEGYLSGTGLWSNWRHTYSLKDHLGNTRVNLSSDYISKNTSKVYCPSGQTDYYPFGMERCTASVVDGHGIVPVYKSGANPYLYNGKEIDRLNGLNEYDYGARWRDPVIGSGWNTMDPLCEKYYNISPYAYCTGNPIRYTDPDGRILHDANGNVVFSPIGKPEKVQHPSGLTATVQNGIIIADNGKPIKAFKNLTGDKGWDTDCHGTTFADGQVWVNNDQVNNILKGDGYETVNKTDAKVGDVVVYKNENGEVVHSVTVVDVKDGKITVEGQGGLEKENHRDNVDKAWKGKATQNFYRKSETTTLKIEPEPQKKDNTNVGSAGNSAD